MADVKGVKVANVTLWYAGADVRMGNIIFGIWDDDAAELNGHENMGYEVYAKKRETDNGVMFGGYVNPAKLNKEDQPEASFYVNFNVYNGDKADITYTISLTEYNAKTKEFGAKVASGALYSTAVKGMSRGYLFSVPVEAQAAKGKSTKKAGKNVADEEVPY